MEKPIIRGDRLLFAIELIRYLHELVRCHYTTPESVRRCNPAWSIPAAYRVLARFADVEVIAGRDLYFSEISAILAFLRENNLARADLVYTIHSVSSLVLWKPHLTPLDVYARGLSVSDLYDAILAAVASGAVTEEMLKEPAPAATP